jgi:hypothetical protein
MEIDINGGVLDVAANVLERYLERDLTITKGKNNRSKL